MQRVKPFLRNPSPLFSRFFSLHTHCISQDSEPLNSESFRFGLLKGPEKSQSLGSSLRDDGTSTGFLWTLSMRTLVPLMMLDSGSSLGSREKGREGLGSGLLCSPDRSWFPCDGLREPLRGE